MTTPQALSPSEFEELKHWFEKHSLPEPIHTLQKRLLDTYSNLTGDKKKQKKLLAEINLLMGLVSSSEKGSSEKRPFGLQ
jgi:hypothetical protein